MLSDDQRAKLGASAREARAEQRLERGFPSASGSITGQLDQLRLRLDHRSAGPSGSGVLPRQ